MIGAKKSVFLNVFNWETFSTTCMQPFLGFLSFHIFSIFFPLSHWFFYVSWLWKSDEICSWWQLVWISWVILAVSPTIVFCWAFFDCSFTASTCHLCFVCLQIDPKNHCENFANITSFPFLALNQSTIVSRAYSSSLLCVIITSNQLSFFTIFSKQILYIFDV